MLMHQVNEEALQSQECFLMRILPEHEQLFYVSEKWLIPQFLKTDNISKQAQILTE